MTEIERLKERIERLEANQVSIVIPSDKMIKDEKDYILQACNAKLPVKLTRFETVLIEEIATLKAMILG